MSGERPCEVCQSITDGTYSPGDDCLGDPGCCEQPMTADRVQRELAEVMREQENCPRIHSLDWSNEQGFTRVVLEVAPDQFVGFNVEARGGTP